MNEVFLATKAKKNGERATAEEFHRVAWGSDYTHIGTYEDSTQSIEQACEQTIVTMSKKLPNIKKSYSILNIGASYGGTARFLAEKYRCKIECLNDNELENKINEQKTAAASLSDLVKIKTGTTKTLTLDYQNYDMVWAQDIFVGKTSTEIQKAFREIARTLKPEGRFIFTDTMLSDDCPADIKDSLYAQLGLDSVLNIAAYKKMVRATDLQLVFVKRMPEQLQLHTAKMLEMLRDNESALQAISSKTFVDATAERLQHWLTAAEAGYLTWGILQFQKRNV